MSVTCEWDGECSGIQLVDRPISIKAGEMCQCYACNEKISIGSRMYTWERIDTEECTCGGECEMEMDTVDCEPVQMSPHIMCNMCGEMSLNLMELGYMFSVDEPVRQQWIDFLKEHNPELHAEVIRNQ